MTRKQKVVHLTSVHTPNDTRIFYKECKSIAEASFDVTYIVPCSLNEVLEGIKIVGIPPVSNRLERMFLNPWRLLKAALKEKGNLYHFHDPELIIVGLFLKLIGKTVIYDIHEDVPRQILSKYWIAKPLRMVISYSVECFENISARFFDALVTATPTIGKRFIRTNRRITNVNNYPILDELHMTVDWSCKEKAVCYVGGISKIRGIHEMVEAMSQINGKLLLAGLFSPMSLRDKIKQKAGWENVVEVGQINRSEVRNLMSRAMAGLVVIYPEPNYISSLPIKMFEYMSAGIPVIASNFPLWQQIIEDNQCGICIDPCNPQALAEAIERVFENPDIAQKMGENGRKAVVSKYNWKMESTKLVHLYHDLLSGNA